MADMTPEEAAEMLRARELERRKQESAAIQKKQDLRVKVLSGQLTEEEATKEAMKS